MILIKSKREIELMRQAGTLVSQVLRELRNALRPGITTAELDIIAEKMIRSGGGIPAFKNYHGFPASICSSINDEVVHGIPSERQVCEQDIVSIDVGVNFNGYFADAARTWPVGTISNNAGRLIEITRNSFFEGMRVIRPGVHLGDVSCAIQSYVESNGYFVVRDFVGHGIGRAMHEEPPIPNFGTQGTGPVLEQGMALAIEPMVNAGTWRVRTLENQWTVVTIDGSLSAHYENTVVVTADGVDILT